MSSERDGRPCYSRCVKPSRPYHAFTAYHREPAGLRRLDFFADRIGVWRGARPPADVRILDIGCGNGNIALPLAGLGYAVTGVDVDAESIRRAARSAEDSGLAHAAFLEGSFERVLGRTFDVVIASEVLEHQKHPDAFLKDVAEHLDPKGLLFLSVPNGKTLEERVRRFTTHTAIGRRAKGWFKRRIGNHDVQSSVSHPHEQFFTWNALVRTLGKAGFRARHAVALSAGFKGFFYLGGRLILKRGSRAFHALDRWDAALASHTPIELADGWLMEATYADPSTPLVMHVVPTLEAGGAERLVYELTKRLPANGFEAEAVSVVRGGLLETLFREAQIPLTIIGRRGLLGLRATRELFRLMRLRRPDVVHTHLFGADVWGRLAARLAGIRVVVSTEHSMNRDHGFLRRFMKRRLVPLTSRFIAVSDEAKAYMVGVEGIPKTKVRVVKNGIDMSRVLQRSARGFHDVPRLITVGRLAPQKGQATLLKALALVASPWTLDVIGTGPLEAELRSLAERLNVAGRIRWLGYRTDVSELLAQADVFCFPSRWEGLGLALLEAAAAGVPVVASGLPVFREVLGDGEATYVPAGDVPALAHALGDILRDPYPAVQRAQAASVRIRAEFSIEKMVGEYAKMYRELMSQKSKVHKVESYGI